MITIALARKISRYFILILPTNNSTKQLANKIPAVEKFSGNIRPTIAKTGNIKGINAL
jgi:hypothetical protein